jgi:hypothetical protein
VPFQYFGALSILVWSRGITSIDSLGREYPEGNQETTMCTRERERETKTGQTSGEREEKKQQQHYSKYYQGEGGGISSDPFGGSINIITWSYRHTCIKRTLY